VSSTPQSPSSTARRLGFVVSAAAILGIAALAFFQAEKRQELSPVARGEKLAVSSGCFACHGRSDADTRGNFRRLASGAWKPKALPTFWENGIDRTDVLVDWITHGVPAEEAEAHKKLLIQMPAYGRRLPADDIEAIAAWILAEGLRLSGGLGNAAVAAPAPESGEKPDDARLFAVGDRLARQHQCYQCHGELGQGGVANLSAFKGYIAGFFGRDFLQLTDGGKREEVLHWIEHGRGNAIESGLSGRLAQFFFRGQAIGMPAYRDTLDDSQRAVLADYLLLLNRKGPLTAKKLEQVSKLLDEAVTQTH
jgi:mono/diheme cytochrome c family protein